MKRSVERRQESKYEAQGLSQAEIFLAHVSKFHDIFISLMETLGQCVWLDGLFVGVRMRMRVRVRVRVARLGVRYRGSS